MTNNEAPLYLHTDPALPIDRLRKNAKASDVLAAVRQVADNHRNNCRVYHNWQDSGSVADFASNRQGALDAIGEAATMDKLGDHLYRILASR